MMTQTDYETVGQGLRLSLPLSLRIKVYRRMVPLLMERDSKFDPVKFGLGMGMPRLLCKQETKKIETELEEVKAWQ